jgi:hypothetical protein
VVGTDREFSKRVVHLLRDQELRHRYGLEAHVQAATRHSWRESAAEVSELLRIVGGGSPGLSRAREVGPSPAEERAG